MKINRYTITSLHVARLVFRDETKHEAAVELNFGCAQFGESPALSFFYRFSKDKGFLANPKKSISSFN